MVPSTPATVTSSPFGAFATELDPHAESVHMAVVTVPEASSMSSGLRERLDMLQRGMDAEGGRSVVTAPSGIEGNPQERVVVEATSHSLRILTDAESDIAAAHVAAPQSNAWWRVVSIDDLTDTMVLERTVATRRNGPEQKLNNENNGKNEGSETDDEEDEDIAHSADTPPKWQPLVNTLASATQVGGSEAVVPDGRRWRLERKRVPIAFLWRGVLLRDAEDTALRDEGSTYSEDNEADTETEQTLRLQPQNALEGLWWLRQAAAKDSRRKGREQVEKENRVLRNLSGKETEKERHRAQFRVMKARQCLMKLRALSASTVTQSSKRTQVITTTSTKANRHEISYVCSKCGKRGATTLEAHEQGVFGNGAGKTNPHLEIWRHVGALCFIIECGGAGGGDLEAVQLRDAWTEWTATLSSWKYLETLGFDRTDLAGMCESEWWGEVNRLAVASDLSPHSALQQLQKMVKDRQQPPLKGRKRKGKKGNKRGKPVPDTSQYARPIINLTSRTTHEVTLGWTCVEREGFLQRNSRRRPTAPVASWWELHQEIGTTGKFKALATKIPRSRRNFTVSRLRPRQRYRFRVRLLEVGGRPSENMRMLKGGHQSLIKRAVSLGYRGSSDPVVCVSTYGYLEVWTRPAAPPAPICTKQRTSGPSNETRVLYLKWGGDSPAEDGTIFELQAIVEPDAGDMIGRQQLRRRHGDRQNSVAPPSKNAPWQTVLASPRTHFVFGDVASEGEAMKGYDCRMIFLALVTNICMHHVICNKYDSLAFAV